MDRYSKAAMQQAEVVKQENRERAAAYIRATQEPGEATDLVLEALGLDDLQLPEKHCPHCHQPFPAGASRCKKIACRATGTAMRETREEASRAGADSAGA